MAGDRTLMDRRICFRIKNNVIILRNVLDFERVGRTVEISNPGYNPYEREFHYDRTHGVSLILGCDAPDPTLFQYPISSGVGQLDEMCGAASSKIQSFWAMAANRHRQNLTGSASLWRMLTTQGKGGSFLPFEESAPNYAQCTSGEIQL